MSNKGYAVFVYGTLRMGDSRHGVHSFIEVLHEEAYLKGHNLLDLGAFPGVVPGDGVVRGEVHLYDTLRVLDGIEGYREDDPKHSLYIREKVMVETPEGNLQAYVYVFNTNQDNSRRVISSGDWFARDDKHRARQSFSV